MPEDDESKQRHNDLERREYIYERWNVVAEHNLSGSTLTRQKVRDLGPDINESPQGSGGAGGLVATKLEVGTTGTYYTGYDPNGDVTEMFNNTEAKVDVFAAEVRDQTRWFDFRIPNLVEGGKAALRSHMEQNAKVATCSNNDYNIEGHTVLSIIPRNWTSEHDPYFEDFGNASIYDDVLGDKSQHWLFAATSLGRFTFPIAPQTVEFKRARVPVIETVDGKTLCCLTYSYKAAMEARDVLGPAFIEGPTAKRGTWPVNGTIKCCKQVK